MSAGSDKSADAFRTISEVATELGLATHVLRFWESKFPQIKPLKRAGGRRYYRPDDVALLKRLQTLLHDEGYTIKGVQKLFREEGARKFIDEGTSAREGDDADMTAGDEPAAHFVAPQPQHSQASLFDAPAPAPTQSYSTPEPDVTPLEPEDLTYTSPIDLLPDAPEPEPISYDEESEKVVIQQGLSEDQRTRLSEVLDALKAMKEEIDNAA